MKASLNGLPNCSILDGWWAEAYNGKNGWAIGDGHEYGNQDEQDWHDVESLYSLLENNIVPLYYDHGPANVPGGWISVMKEAIASVAPVFSAHRQVKEYTERFYLPAIRSSTAEQPTRTRARKS
jgi:starch phosphorylase